MGKFDHIETWIFDLDNTLYPPATTIGAQMEQRICGFIAQHFKVSMEEAFQIQKRLFRTYGTTLRGLMTEYQVPAAEYLDYVHDLDFTVLVRDHKLEAALTRLPGRKVIYTNATTSHAKNVLRTLGLTDHFADIFDIVAADYEPKPSRASYDLMVSRHAIDPKRAIMFEDMARNLVPAAAMGMTTVWVRQDGHRDREVAEAGDLSHIHHTIDDLPAWLEQALLHAEPIKPK